MADIDKELHQIKNAVYGREVRGSIHDGIKKINEESEESKAKADEAHEVMESIMTEGFDNAALESNFAQKLDDKIANLQPEWTQFKDDTVSQLAQIEQQKADKSEVNDLASDKADKSYVVSEVNSLNNRISNVEDAVGKFGNWSIEENASLDSLDFIWAG